MAQDSSVSENKSKGLPTIAKVGIGCFVLLVVLGVLSTIIGGMIAKKVGKSLIEGAIEKNTGVKTNLNDIEKGKMTFTDTKTGAKVEVGTGKVPDTFPKDFPLYPGAKVLSAMSGNEQGKKNGFWLTFTTSDSFEKVSTYYKTSLKSSGWNTTSTFEAGTTTTLGVAKGALEGAVTIAKGDDSKETSISVVLGESSNTTTNTPTDTPESGP